ncbi:dimethylmenaquinone methyltransferase [Litorivita pollutaquae]|uniref:Dimethylmenaquinone methyltransferase n=1 Tax=Litorivita pollutaquae TaxID=2200892 RepID=A0A2V4MMA2_9RHOB|nr:TraR/DksA C4-type zinc finger protein [Litorivita pollutaquae]OUS22150.1 dimethylmenaquinone methyltransferase [Rhodobacterales bacterium 59_46_T64]PYC46719.1 dimethylmenaquinone methyltransferase [Litorivita pollutaquae]
MNAIQHPKARLLARLKELDGRLHAVEAELEEPHSKDWDDMAIEREGDEVLEGLGEAGAQEILRIRAALQRLRDGTFGECVRCGEQISAARLEVLPDTPYCKNCAA